MNSLRFYGFLFLSFYVASYSVFPTVTHDENAVHLALWTQLEFNGKFAVDVASQIWSAAPNTVALIHAVTSLIAGADSKGALNAYLFIFSLSSIFAIFRHLNLNKNDCILLVTLFVSTPIIPLTMVSLQTDLFLGLLMLSTALAILSLNDHKTLAVLGGVFCSAIALSAKLPGILIAIPAVFFILAHFFRSRHFKNYSRADWIKLFLLLTVATILAVGPYLKAYYWTGNPVFPLYNEIFKSPYIGSENFKDERWFHGANMASFIGLFFNSTAHMEVSNNFVGGLQYFLIMPVAFFLVVLNRNPKLCVVATMMAFYVLPIFLSLQYLRYFYAAMPLASVLIGFFFLHIAWNRWLKLFIAAGIYLLVFLNFCFMPGISWLFVYSPFSLVSSHKAEELSQNVVPEVGLNKFVNQVNKGAKVFMALGRPYGATLATYPILNQDYSYVNYVDRKKWESEEDILKDFTSWGVDLVYWYQGGVYPAGDTATVLLNKLLIAHGRPVLQSGALVAFSMTKKNLLYTPIFSFVNPNQFEVTGRPQVDQSALKLLKGDILTATLNVSGYSAFKYQVKYFCESGEGFFVAQINWDAGTAYYRLLECTKEPTLFTEVGLVPPGTQKATLYLSSRAKHEVTVTDISVSTR